MNDANALTGRAGDAVIRRTYNFPQGRVTDHRIKLTLHRLEGILNGDLDEIIDSLIAADQAAKLSNLQNE